MTTAIPSRVMAVPPAESTEARRHFEAKLAFESDPSDVWDAIKSDAVDFLIVDCRSTGNHTKTHLPGAISLPWEEITEERVRDLPDLPIVTYCWSPACNASTKGAARLAALGRPVKEMIGGLEHWLKEGYPTEGRRPVEAGNGKPADWGHVV